MQPFIFTDGSGVQYTSIMVICMDGVNVYTETVGNSRLDLITDKYHFLSAINIAGVEKEFYTAGKIIGVEVNLVSGAEVVLEEIIMGEGWNSESYKTHTIPTQEVSDEFYDWYITHTNYLSQNRPFQQTAMGSRGVTKTAKIWIDPIFDRTTADVTFALQQIAAWKKSHSHAGDVKTTNDQVHVSTEGETYVDGNTLVLRTTDRTSIENNHLVLELGVVYDLKGCLNLSDITRIEDDIEYLSNLLIGYHFPISINSKEWTTAGLPNSNDMKRIGNKIGRAHV